MPRIRSIRPEFWSDEKIGRLSFGARLLYIALWSFADDDGYGRALPKELAGFAFPYDDAIDSPHVRGMLGELSGSGLVTLYEVSGNPYYWIPTFKRYQKPDKPTPSRLPKPDEAAVKAYAERFLTASGNVPRTVVEPSGSDPPIGNRNQEVGNRNQEVGKSVPPDGATNPPPSPSSKPKPEFHPEADRLANILADLIEANGSKRPRVTDAWRDAIDKLIRIDKRAPSDIERAIRWSQAHHFWRSNILSAAKLREKYDTMRLQAIDQAKAQAKPQERTASNGNDPDQASGEPGHESLTERLRRREAGMLEMWSRDSGHA